MKRLLAALVIALMLMGMALSVSADPIEVGGNFTSSASSSRGPVAYKGNGNPQGVPFQSSEFSVLFSPIEVGGN